MTCTEFQQQLPEIVDGEQTAEQESHLQACRMCSELLADLNTISELAVSLRDSDEPSPRVWNSIEIALRKEGLIRQPQREPNLVVIPGSRRWNPVAWLLPVVATALAVFGVLAYRRAGTPSQTATVHQPPPIMGPLKASATGDKEDEQVLDIVAARVPNMRAAYASNLRQVNAYIQDAQDSVQRDPNDEEAQQALMAAYEQKSVVYQMAMDRSLP